MSSRSLNVAPQHIQKVKDSLKRNGFRSQQAFATEMGFSRDTVRKFLNGKNVDRNNFIDFCKKLGLDWQEIVDKPVEIEKDPNFVGRENAIADLHNLTQQHKLILIHAGGGIGKTELSKKYLKNQGLDKVIEFLMAKETQSVSSIEGVVEEWIKQFGQEPARDFMINLGRLRKLLESQRVGILIDNLEPALNKGKFIEPHRNYVDLLEILGKHDGKSVTLITSREKLAESAIKIETYPLEGLTEEAWQDYFSHHNINIDQPTLKAMRDAYGGNAKAMDILRGAILEDNQGDMVEYWEENQGDLLVKRELEDLVTSQFNRLENHDPEAYNLLCRLGCYRYQDVPTVPTEGLLCLLWDVADRRKKRVIESLKSRGLVEHKNHEYWLHPVIKQEAIDRIKETEDWEKANRQAADFWTDSVKSVETVDHALKALEAYYHYMNIEDYEQAGFVITKTRNNKWDEDEHLGNSLLRVGLLLNLTHCLDRITQSEQILPSFSLSKLFNLSGTLQRTLGNLHSAIKSYEKSREIATQCLDNKKIILEHNNETLFWLNRMISLSYFHQGMCNLELLEIKQSLSHFNELYQLIQTKPLKEIGIKQHEVDNYGGLAFCHFSLGNQEKAMQFAQKTYDSLFSKQLSGWGKGYEALLIAQVYTKSSKSLYINKALDIYKKIFEFTEEDYYRHIKAKASTGRGELHRIKKEYDTAINYHHQSIEILEELRAKCDLAEAYYQFALTYQERGEIDESKKYFNEAIELFTEIEAPKQIERVKNSIQTS